MADLETPFLDEIIEGGVGAIATTELWEEIRDNLGGGGGPSDGVRGSVTLGGSAGVTVTIPDMGSDGYDISYFIVKGTGALGAVGEISFEAISGTQFKVYNTGSDTTSTLRYWVIPQSFAEARGTATLGGMTGVLVTMPVDLETEEYDVFTWVTRHANTGSTGEISVEIIGSTQFVIYNTGSDDESTINYWAVTR